MSQTKAQQKPQQHEQTLISTRVLGSPASRESVGRLIVDLGFEGMFLDEGVRRPDWDFVRGFFPPRFVQGLFLFAPLPAPTARGLLPPPRLTALDADERREVGKWCRRSVEFASDAEILHIVVPPAEVEIPDAAEIRRTVERGGAPQSWSRVRRRRGEAASTGRHLDSFLRSLSTLLDLADRYECTVSLLPGGLPSQLPGFGELDHLRREFSGAPLRVLVDTLYLARAERVELDGVADFLAGPLEGILGFRVHDGDLLHEGLAPVAGDAKLDRGRELAARVSEERLLWLLDVRPGVSAADLERGRQIACAPVAEGDGKGPRLLDTPLRDLL